MSTTKVMRKLSAQIQTGATYESNAAFLMPFVSESIMQKYDDIADESILGVGFKDIAQQGVRHVEGSISQNLDVVSCAPILEAAFGALSSQVYTLGTNSKKLSLCALNDINAIRYANVYVKKIKLSSSVNNLWKLDYDVLGVTAQDRVATSNFPTVTAPDDPFTFHETGGTTGYVRLGNTADALAAGDNINIEDFSLEINTGFDAQYCNVGLATLTPAFGMVEASCSGSFKVARHDADTLLAWQDAHTALQMAIYIYKSATDNILIEIPRLVIKVDLTDDDIAKQSVEMMIGRNGVGTSYKNANMAFTSPVRITTDNS